MNKNTLKQIILAINESSLESQSKEELIERVQERTQISKTTILQAIDLLYQHKALEWLQEEVDLFPCAVIFCSFQTQQHYRNLVLLANVSQRYSLLERTWF